MGYITGWIVVGIITLGIYKLFELFVGKKERLTMIEKLGDKLDPSMLGNRLSLPLPVGTPFMSSSPISFSALKFGCLLLGMGLERGYIKRENIFFFLKSVTSLATQRLMNTKEQN